MLEQFDALMEHLGSREDEMARAVRTLLENYISEAESSALWLECLEGAGVDNWSGFDYAQDMFSENSHESDDD